MKLDEKPETEIEKAILENGIGMYAICADGVNGFAYWIAGLYKVGDVPEGLEFFTFLESNWAIFTAKGPIPQSLQSLNTQVWKQMGTEHKNNDAYVFDDNKAEMILGDDYEKIAESLTQGIFIRIIREPRRND